MKVGPQTSRAVRNSRWLLLVVIVAVAIIAVVVFTLVRSKTSGDVDGGQVDETGAIDGPAMAVEEERG